MNFWILLQTILNLALISSVVGLWLKLNRPQKDDPRLSKGLQLLQNKISVIEDLSDRTDTQVKQLTTILESKVKDVAAKMEASEKQIHRIEQVTQRSLEVAQIFQDRIPHEEIMERQNTIKYVTAAQLAHKGLSVDEIAEQVALSRGEIEFIAKVNKDQLMFCEEALPDWAADGVKKAKSIGFAFADDFKFVNPELGSPLHREMKADISKAFAKPAEESNALKKLGEEFKKAVSSETGKGNASNANSSASSKAMPQDFIELTPTPSRSNLRPTENAEGEFVVTSNGKSAVVKPMLFPKIDLKRDLT